MEADHREGVLFAPCDFRLDRILIKEGTEVQAGDPIFSVKSSGTSITTPVSGRVVEIHIIPSQKIVGWGTPLVTINPESKVAVLA